jgi:hypothetical protein
MPPSLIFYDSSLSLLGGMTLGMPIFLRPNTDESKSDPLFEKADDISILDFVTLKEYKVSRKFC